MLDTCNGMQYGGSRDVARKMCDNHQERLQEQEQQLLHEMERNARREGARA